jgi:CRP/FNR family transcriptional regulator, cyclic AMP receptor protein
MLERFQGLDGKNRLITALTEQKIIHGDETLANAIADIAELKEYSSGTEIAHQNDTDSDIYLIITGCVSVFVNGREIAKRQAGLHVGEMALIDSTVRRSATLKATEHTIVAKITEPLFTELADKHPKLWRRIAVELVHRLRERGKLIKHPNDKPLVFIASSKEYLPFAVALQDGIKSDDVIVKIWTDDIFEASATAIESLEAALESYDIGVVIFGADDLVESRGNEKLAPRDNIVLELGLMMGAFGRNRTFIAKPQPLDIKIPSDLLGIVCLNFDNVPAAEASTALVKSSEFLRNRISNLGPR